MQVALATENNAVDGKVIVELVRMVRGIAVEPWASDKVDLTGGWKGVVRATTTFLNYAADAGVRHAIVMIDNDGGATRRPAHEPTHAQGGQASNEDDGCATCLIAEQLPVVWRAQPHFACIVVPVQTLDTWLLVASGAALKNPTPEFNYHRRVLKKALYGDKLHAGDVARCALALACLEPEGALVLLRQRPSFGEFERKPAAWP